MSNTCRYSQTHSFHDDLTVGCLLPQALLDDRVALEQEKSHLLGNQASLQSQVQQLHSSVVQLQQELQESHTELERCKRGEEGLAKKGGGRGREKGEDGGREEDRGEGYFLVFTGSYMIKAEIKLWLSMSIYGIFSPVSSGGSSSQPPLPPPIQYQMKYLCRSYMHVHVGICVELTIPAIHAGLRRSLGVL